MRAYIGTVYLKSKGKVYGAKTSQINARDIKSAKNKLKKRFKFGDNVVINFPKG